METVWQSGTEGSTIVQNRPLAEEPVLATLEIDLFRMRSIRCGLDAKTT